MRHRTESKTSPRRIQAVFKQRQALELRMAGRNYDEIAEALGYAGHTSALAAVNKALEKTLEEPSQRYRWMPPSGWSIPGRRVARFSNRW
mgnify:CR=1 FL=1